MLTKDESLQIIQEALSTQGVSLNDASVRHLSSKILLTLETFKVDGIEQTITVSSAIGLLKSGKTLSLKAKVNNKPTLIIEDTKVESEDETAEEIKEDLKSEDETVKEDLKSEDETVKEGLKSEEIPETKPTVEPTKKITIGGKK